METTSEQQHHQQRRIIATAPPAQPPQKIVHFLKVRGNCTEISYKSLHFLITERPSDIGMGNYIEELKKYNVSKVVRVCEPTYNTEKLAEVGIGVVDLHFQDGTPPTGEIIDRWFDLLRSTFTSNPETCIAVHCVAGLGRAPVLVALSLIELGMKYEDAVELIRGKRRGAINAKQLTFLEHYKPKQRLKLKSHPHNSANGQSSCCVT